MKKKYLVIHYFLISLGLLGFYMDTMFEHVDELSKVIGGCGKGPCIPLGPCGGAGGGMGSCQFDGISCYGHCPSYCPTGSPDMYCLGIVGECSEYAVQCTRIREYTCRARQYGPPGCVCDLSVITNRYCPRNRC